MRLHVVSGWILAIVLVGLGCQQPTAPLRTQRLPPEAPTDVVAEAGDALASLQWKAPKFAGSAPILQYVVTTVPGGNRITTTETSLLIDGLQNGTSYTFTVFATNEFGNGAPSLPSNPVTPHAPTVVPDAPTDVTATADDSQAHLIWNAPSYDGGEAISRYTVKCVEEDLSLVTVTTSALITGLTNGRSYTFTVSATNVNGDGPPSLPSNAVTPSTLPGVVTDVVATAGDAQVSLSWTAPADDGGNAVSNYLVRYAPGNGVYETGGATSAVISGLTNGTAYVFTIHAINKNGSGIGVNSDPVTPKGVPGAPINVQAKAGDSQATVTWSVPPDNGSPIKSYTVRTIPGGATIVVFSPIAVLGNLVNGVAQTFEVAATNDIGTGPWSSVSNTVTPVSHSDAPRFVVATAGDGQVSLTWQPPLSSGGNAIIDYQIVSNHGGTPILTQGATSVIIQGLTNGASYVFTVFAINGLGPSTGTNSNVVVPAGVPFAPTNVTATAGEGQATVTWTAPSNNGSAITSYTVKALPGNAEVVVNGTMAVIPNLMNGIAYTFAVAATNSVGTGPWSTPSTPVTPATRPSAPRGVVATAGDGYATLTWLPPADSGGSPITDYLITSNLGGVPIATQGGTMATIPGLTNGTSYVFTVFAVNAIGMSSGTNSNVVVPAGLPDAPMNLVATGGNALASPKWDAPSGHGSPIKSYTVRIQPGGSTLTVAATNAVIPGLINGKTYAFEVAATNSVGMGPWSAQSNEVTPGAVPGAPTNVIATARHQSALVSWAAPANDGGLAITKYVVTSYPGGLTRSVSGATQLTFTSLTNGTAYTFTVHAENALGAGPESLPSNAVIPALTPSTATSTLVASTNTLFADGRSVTILTATILNAEGLPVPNQPVRFETVTSTETLLPAAPKTNASGQVTAKLSGIRVGNRTIRAFAGSLALSTTITFTSPGCTTSPNFLATALSIGSPDSGIGSADMNGDGILDVVTTHWNTNITRVSLGNGNGTFKTPKVYSTLTKPNFNAFGDFDSDGYLDIAVTNEDAGGSIGLYSNLGNGDLAAPSTVAGLIPGHIFQGDFNNDGALDLVAHQSNQTVGVLLGHGDGSFPKLRNSPVVSGSVRLAVADFNADGKLDVATVNGGQKNFGVLLGKGDGSFENPVTYPVTRNAWAITAGDVDGNGTVDVVVGEEGPTGPSVQTFLGVGNGTFAAPLSSPYTMTTPNDAELADFNGDGILDVVFADLVANRVVYLPGLGNGTFGTSVVFPLTALTNSSVDLSVGDFNGDSRLDIVVANSAQSYFTLLTNRCAP